MPWVLGDSDSGDSWVDRSDAYDGNDQTWATDTPPDIDVWTDYLTINYDSAILSPKVSLWPFPTGFPSTLSVEIDVFYNGEWHTIYADLVANLYIVTEYEIGSLELVSAIRIRGKITSGPLLPIGIREFQLWHGPLSLVKLLYITDNHIYTDFENESYDGYLTDPSGYWRHTDNAVIRLIAAIDQANLDLVDCAIQGGDMLKYNHPEGDRAVYVAAVDDNLTAAGGKMVNCNGNHDNFQADIDAMKATNPAIDNLWWPNGYNADTPYSFTYDIQQDAVDVMRVVVLGDGSIEASGSNSSGAIAHNTWIDTIAFDTALPIVVVRHRAVIVQRKPAAGFFSPESDALKESTLVALMEAQGNVQMVLTGHWHVDGEVQVQNGIVYLKGQAACLGLSETDTDSNCFYIIEIEPNAIAGATQRRAKITINGYGYGQSYGFTRGALV